MHFNTTQWESSGLAINWQTLFTTKLISGLVRVAYCKTPTIEWYRVGSENRSTPNLDNLQLETIGEEMKWASAMCFVKQVLISRPRK